MTFDLKSTEELSFMTLMGNAKFEEKLTCGLKMTWGIWQIFTRRLGSVKIGTLMYSFCLKQKAKKSRKIMCKETEEWWKVWRGSDLLFQNRPKEFEKFWLDHTKFSIVCTLMGCFWSKYVMFQLNKYRGIQRIMYIEDTEEWWKIWRLIDLSF